MNSKAQSELHPGADLLNAFAEQALPDPERARILAHMAGCARCREVVYVARAAADAELARAAAVHTPARPGWFFAARAKWRLALVPAAALAAAGGVVLWVQTHSASPPSQTAEMAPAPPAPGGTATAYTVAPPAASSSAPAPSKAPTRPVAQVHPVAPPRPAPSAAKRAIPRSNGMQFAFHGTLAGAAAPALNKPLPAVSVPPAVTRSYGDVHLDGRSASMARYAPPPQPVRPPNTWVSRTQSQGGPEWLNNNQQMVQGAPDLNNQAPASVATQAPQSGGVLSVNDQLAAPAPLDPAQVLQSSQQLERVTQSSSGFALMQLARRARLPSGLHAVSTAALLNRLLVIDSAGAVFLSQDAGKHWETVNAQWSGKAIEVQAPPEGAFMRALGLPGPQHAPEASPGSASEEIGASPAAPVPAPNSAPALSTAKVASIGSPALPPMLFTLVTDRHQTWVSADGKLWREPKVKVSPPGAP